MEIVNYIGTGKENAITRDALCAIMNMSDRAVRQAIEDARHSGHIILNDQDGAGYYMTDDIKDIERQYRQNERRALSILHYQKHLRRRLKAAGR
jgi:hypothetical protein